MPETDQTQARAAQLLALLADWYESRGCPLPAVQIVESAQIPPIPRRLLVHERDMTGTLETFHGRAIRLRTLDRHCQSDQLQRTVCLVGVDDGRPVEFGAIRIHLEAFGPPARAQIEQCEKPLGAILRDHGVRHTSRPTAFFRVEADTVIRDALAISSRGEPCTLYGRHNELSGPGAVRLAEVVEILPPA